MEKGKHGILIFIIGVLAVVVFAVSVVVDARNLLVGVNFTNINDIFSLALTTDGGVVELGFSILKITIGISLIKQWKKSRDF
ncbi:MAG: hypothetical protein IJW43_04505 [Clostridia bacterium]|nr:hypothetical protein [Clostridia bacterium]